MSDRDEPNKITVVEIYASQEAYNSHIASPHFLKYKNGTMKMVDSLKLTRTKPIVFAAKGE
jgi:quinol monooxygenase YgiN